MLNLIRRKLSPCQTRKAAGLSSSFTAHDHLVCMFFEALETTAGLEGIFSKHSAAKISKIFKWRTFRVGRHCHLSSQLIYRTFYRQFRFEEIKTLWNDVLFVNSGNCWTTQSKLLKVAFMNLLASNKINLNSFSLVYCFWRHLSRIIFIFANHSVELFDLRTNVFINFHAWPWELVRVQFSTTFKLCQFGMDGKKLTTQKWNFLIISTDFSWTPECRQKLIQNYGTESVSIFISRCMQNHWTA